MSTCSTATGRDGHGDERRRHASCEDAVCGGLERRWRELEREWDVYKTSRCSGDPPSRRHHRRSRSATGTPYSTIVTAQPVDAPGSLLGLCLCGSPMQLVSSLQRTSSGGTASHGVTAEHGAKNQVCRYDDEDDHDAGSSVCSVDAVPMTAMPMATSSCSCSCCCCCAVPRCGCGYCHSSFNSSCSSAATSLFSLLDKEAIDDKATKAEEARWATSSIGRFVAIAVAGVVLVAAMATAILELAMDDGQAEFLVPT